MPEATAQVEVSPENNVMLVFDPSVVREFHMTPDSALDFALKIIRVAHRAQDRAQPQPKLNRLMLRRLFKKGKK